MKHYMFQTPGKIVAGRHALERLHDVLDEIVAGGTAYVLTQPFIADLGFLDVIRRQLERKGMSCVWNTDVEMEPTTDNICRIFRHFLEHPGDIIIGIGGGSVLDAAKLLAVMKTNDVPLEDMVKPGSIRHAGLPLLLIPTTAGTGSEVTPNAIVTFPEKAVKVGIVSRHLLPVCVILDPVLTVSMPPSVTAATGMDAFTHALESYISNKANPISDAFALESVRLISRHLLRAYENPQDLKAREAMLVGAMLGGMALTGAGTAAGHAMAYPLGGAFNIPHGVANSMLLPHVTRFNLDAVEDRLADLAEAAGLADGTAKRKGRNRALAEKLIELAERGIEAMNIPQDLTAYRVAREDVPALAAAASGISRLMDNNPKPMSQKDIEMIYLQLFRKGGQA